MLKSDLQIDAVRARKPRRLPVVLSPAEVRAILDHIPQGPRHLMVSLMYGAGLRLMEACRLRVKDLDLERNLVVVREGKGDKDRYVPLPLRLVRDLKTQRESVAMLHVQDLAIGAGWVWLPYALAVKWPCAGRSLSWQYLFPADRLSCDSHPREFLEGPPEGACVSDGDANQLRRHHVHESTV